jgi:hypothetical protein
MPSAVSVNTPKGVRPRVAITVWDALDPMELDKEDSIPQKAEGRRYRAECKEAVNLTWKT